jgi:quinolinate synthase
MLDQEELKKKIIEIKNKKNAVIVAHNYQVGEVQDIADMVGDSFALSKYCTGIDADVIVFCGVHFMAESAKILSPDKTVLLPEIDAGCPMANMITAEELREKKKQHPEAAVVCYVNTSAEVKAESDVCCTSSNAVNIIRAIEEEEIIFVPDKNLGGYISKMVPEKKIIQWDGFCVTHHRVRANDVEKARSLHPDAILLAHPECRPEVTKLADFVGSTKQILDYAKNSQEKKFIIGTEMGILHSLEKDNPDKTFYLLAPSFICPNMKKTSLMSVYNALAQNRYNIEVEENIRVRAKKALSRMLELS